MTDLITLPSQVTTLALSRTTGAGLLCLVACSRFMYPVASHISLTNESQEAAAKFEAADWPVIIPNDDDWLKT